MSPALWEQVVANSTEQSAPESVPVMLSGYPVEWPASELGRWKASLLGRILLDSPARCYLLPAQSLPVLRNEHICQALLLRTNGGGRARRGEADR